MFPDEQFRGSPPEFWALAKLASQELQYSQRGTGKLKRYTADQVVGALKDRGLNPEGHDHMIEKLIKYVDVRGGLLEDVVEPNLMNRDEACDLFEQVREETGAPDELLSMNKQKGDKRHYAFLSCMVAMLTWKTLNDVHGEAEFDWNPRGPLTFSRDGMPLRTLSRRMDGAYPNANQPYAAWEIKEYYGTTTYGSRVNAIELESALDGHELKDLRAERVEVKHYVFLDARDTLWNDGKPLLCRLVDMLHTGLLDGAFFGRELVKEWPGVVAKWPAPEKLPG